MSCLAFSLGAVLPMLAGCFIADYQKRVLAVSAASTAALALFGSIGAGLGECCHLFAVFATVATWLCLAA